MSIKEFTERIAEKVKARLTGVDVTPQEAWKNNSVIQHGLQFRRDEDKVAPVLYLNQWFKLFKDGQLSEQEILEQVIRTYETLPAHNIPDMEAWLLDEDFIDKVNLRLVNWEKNKDMIAARNLVHYDLEGTDLTCLFYAEVVTDDSSFGEVALTEQLLERCLPNIANVDALYHEVVNKVEPDEVRLETIEDLMARLAGEILTDMFPCPVEKNFMHVLSYRSMRHGAAALLCSEARKQILERFPDGKVTVLPSSIGEVILLPTRDDEEVDVLREMVQQVNETEVSEDDFLSNNVFHYDAATGEIKIAEFTEGDGEV